MCLVIVCLFIQTCFSKTCLFSPNGTGKIMLHAEMNIELLNECLCTSIGEQLYHLCQGSQSVNEYALWFRTLAAPSGWNERSLLSTYRQGLDPCVRLHLTAYDDTTGLERFIKLSIRLYGLMQSCLEGHQGHAYSTFLRRSASVSPPEPRSEPMQVENTRLSHTERQRQLTQGLCLYCSASGHVIHTCPVRPPCSLVSVIQPSRINMQPLTTEIMHTASSISIPAHTLIDSGPEPSATSSTSRQRPPRSYTRSYQ